MTTMKGFRKFLVLFGIMLISSSMCAILYIGNMSTYIYSLHYSQGDLDKFDIDVSWLLPVYLVCKLPGALIVDWSAKTIGLRLTVVFGMILSICSMLATYFTVSYSIWATTLTFALIGGIGNNLLLTCNYLYIAGWCKKRAGFVTSLTIFSGAVSGMVVNQIITAYINPDNLSPDAKLGPISYFSQPELLERIPMVFVVIGILTVSLQVPGFLLLKEPPSNIELGEESNILESQTSVRQRSSSFRGNGVDLYTSGKESKQTGRNGKLALEGNSFDAHVVSGESLAGRLEGGSCKTNNGVHARNQEGQSHTPMQVLKSATFYYLQCALFSLSVGLLIVENYFKVFGQLWINDDQFLAVVGSSMSFSVIVTMPPCGYLLDRFGVKNTLIGHLATSTVFLSLWYLVAQPSRWLYLVWVIVVFLANFNQLIIFPMASLRLFGREHYAANFGLMQLATLLVCFLGPPLLTSTLASLGWFWLFVITACMTFASMVPVMLKMPQV